MAPTRKLQGSSPLAFLALAVLALPAAAQDWAGPYIGANIGYVHGDFDNNIPANPGPIGDSGSAIGGIQAGYNWTSGNAVFGLEADISALDIYGQSPGGRFEEDWMGTLRFRAGTVVAQDYLIYGTVGVAWTRKSITLTGAGTDEEWEPGLALGAGVERWFGVRTSGRLELLYVDVPESTQIPGGVPAVGGSSNLIARVGVNLHF